MKGGGKIREMSEYHHFKDQGLDTLAEQGRNIAQFVSHAPSGEQRYSRTLGTVANHTFASVEDAASQLLANTTEHSVNVRSFDPSDPKSKPFDYGITNAADVAATVRKRHDEGLHTIINETISVDDGGVSGVALGNVLEFAPFDTPRCVEKPGTAQLPRAMGIDALTLVYGFTPNLPVSHNMRTEFSVHPMRHGCLNDHTITWETERVDVPPFEARIQWPNKFSKMLGDKTYGLIIADLVGLPVPRTTVFNRTVRPFTFGRATGSHETWLRTAPNSQTPGKYTTTYGWVDPYALLAKEDPEGTAIASILSQESVDAVYSGACIMTADNQLLIEGKSGKGDTFMVGEQGMEMLPDYIEALVANTYQNANERLGPVRMEWVYDGTRVWIAQLHVGKSASTAQVLFPGDNATQYTTYKTADGLEGLRSLIESRTEGQGITLHGNVGVTSHFGDILRKANIPSNIVRP